MSIFCVIAANAPMVAIGSYCGKKWSQMNIPENPRDSTFVARSFQLSLFRATFEGVAINATPKLTFLLPELMNTITVRQG